MCSLIWPKIIEVVRFRKGLPISKQPGKGKIGQNTSFDSLAKAVDDPTIPSKLRFFEKISMSLNDVLVTFQTYNPMVPFLSESLDNVLVLEEEALFTRRSRLTLMIKLTKCLWIRLIQVLLLHMMPKFWKRVENWMKTNYVTSDLVP